MYKFDYKLTDKDYWEFNKFHHLNAPSSKNAITNLRLIFIIIPAFLILLSFIRQDEIYVLLIKGVFFVILAIVGWFISKPIFISSVGKQIKMLAKDGKLPYGNDVSIQFDEDLIVEITERNETKTKYTSIEKVVISDCAIYVYFSAIQAFLLPFSVFETEEQRDAFLTFINQKIDVVREN